MNDQEVIENLDLLIELDLFEQEDAAIIEDLEDVSQNPDSEEPA